MDNLNGDLVSPPESISLRRRKLGALFAADVGPNLENGNEYDDSGRHSHSYRHISDVSPSVSPPVYNPTSFYYNPNSVASSPYNSMSPWSQSSPYTKSPWIHVPAATPSSSPGDEESVRKYSLVGSLVREEGHVYSLAASGDLLYTGSDGKNVRVWKNFREFSGFKSSSGLLKAIVLYGDKIFTGHQDGRIRIWRCKGKNHKRIGSLPTPRDLFVKSMNPRNYVEVRRRRSVPWIKHYDTVSCLSVDVNQGLLYSGSWDKTLKVWRISDSKCLESKPAHDDALNSVAVAFDGLVFTGSADGTVKAWRRKLVGRSTRHVLVETILRQDHAVTSLAVSLVARTVYAGTSDGLVSFWERARHFMAYGGVLRGHKLAVLCLEAAGRLLLSGSADKSICVWRRDGGGVHTCVKVLTGHAGPVKCLAMVLDVNGGDEDDDDGKRWLAYSGSLDGSVKVWKVSER